MRAKWLAALVLVSPLMGCERIDAWLHPFDDNAVVRTTPVPPAHSGEPRLYPEGDGVSLQLRARDCKASPCYAFRGGRWHRLKPEAVNGIALLAVEGATGSAYGEDLWSDVGTSGDRILINAGAARDNISHGGFDGVRIGLKRAGDTRPATYVTAFAFSGSGASLRLTPDSVAVYVGAGKAWLVHQSPGGATNLIDLFGLQAQSGPAPCLPGLYVSTTPGWAGPAQHALSPNIFESRLVEPGPAAAIKAEVLACAAKAIP